MKTAEQIFQEQNGFGVIGNNVSITLTKNDIYRAMEKYADQLRKPAVIKSVCDHEYITDANWKSLTCRKCNDRIQPKQIVL